MERHHEIGSEHEQGAVRQIDDVHDAEDKRESRRHQEEQDAELNAVERLLQKQQATHHTRTRSSIRSMLKLAVLGVGIDGIGRKARRRLRDQLTLVVFYNLSEII